MNLRRATQVAQQTLSSYDASSLPVDVESVARQLGVRIVRRQLEDEVSAVLVIHNDEASIGVNARHHLNRQRFSIAHELAHYLLHRDEARVFVDSTLTFYRDQRSSYGLYEQEVEANAFAAELLMPTNLIRQLTVDQHLDLHDEATVRRLAKTFAVSEQALLIRLGKLNLLPG